MSRKNTMEWKLELNLDIDIEYDYTPPYAGTMETPPEPASIEINKVKFKGLDITEYLEQNNFDYGALADEMLNKI